ncbi:HD domain-containing protein [Acetobacter pasteurianus]|uniref:HD/PDEase domain-containing protein n=1 Tax=Acetobacter pasteurianus NBRC 3188 TaxID=1226663 RepID=A0A401WYX0_ACEPA|nr:hypothetical protein [Acetobacter pasteurianus]GCD54506.1 hypothetical protein NBRC3188_3203 [Acetobacter pasteurianus NBRC 3188]
MSPHTPQLPDALTDYVALASQIKKTIESPDPKIQRKEFNAYRDKVRVIVFDHCPPYASPPLVYSDRVTKSLRSVANWVSLLTGGDKGTKSFVYSMISSATELCGNRREYHNYRHMFDVLLNAGMLTSLWFDSFECNVPRNDRNKIFLAMILAAAFHDVVMEYHSPAGTSERESSNALLKAHKCYAFRNHNSEGSNYLRYEVELASRLILGTVPSFRKSLKGSVARLNEDAMRVNPSQDLLNECLECNLGAILADADVMDSLCYAYPKAIGQTNRVRRELWSNGIDANVTLDGFYTTLVPDGFISVPERIFQPIFALNLSRFKASR